MKATIWHNPRCSKSREALALLDAAGAEIRIVEYLKAPPARDALADLLARAGLSAREGLRKDAPEDARASDEAALAAMAADPALIERPLVETEKGVRLCRPVERLREIL